MTTLQSVISIIILCSPLLLIKILTDSANVYMLGYLTGLAMALKLIIWFG